MIHNCPLPYAPWATCRVCDAYEGWLEDEGAALQDAYADWLDAQGVNEDDIAAREAVEASGVTGQVAIGYLCAGSTRCTQVVEEDGALCIGCETDMWDAYAEQRYAAM